MSRPRAERLFPLAAIAVALLAFSAPVSAADDAVKAKRKLADEGLSFTEEKFLLKVFHGDAKMVELFLKAGMPATTADEKGEPALVKAAGQEDGKVVALLLKAGADPNAANDNGTTPLCKAADNEAAKNVEALLKAGADPKTVCGFGRTALHEAAEEGDGPIVQMLLKAGAAVEARDQYQQTPLYFAAKADKPDALKALLSAGADPDAKLKHGQTILHEATEWDQPENARILVVEGGATVDAKDSEGRTPLHLAGAYNRVKMVPLLLDLGADPNAKNRRGQTPRQMALEAKSPDTAAMLEGAKKKDVPPGARPARAASASASGGGPAEGAAALRSTDPKGDLKKMGLSYDEKTWWGRVDAEDVKAILLFLQAGFDPATRNRQGRPALYVAVDGGKTPVVTALLAGGANANDAGKGPAGMDYGETLALKAVDQNDAEILKALVAKGTNVKKGNQYAITPLHEAARQGKLEMVEVLLAAGADPNARAAGAPLLFGPVNEDKVDAVKALLKGGAKVGKDRQLLAGAAKSPEMKKLLQGAK